MNRARPLHDVELLVLLALIRLAPKAYGVPIAREIEAAGKRLVALGSVYAALERLAERGLVRSELGEATQERGGRAKRYFQITAEGLREVRSTRQAFIGMWQGMRSAMFAIAESILTRFGIPQENESLMGDLVEESMVRADPLYGCRTRL
jgi:PadR family transcriptional regulator, regulatory protein PadR